jgi:hypothetical protein
MFQMMGVFAEFERAMIRNESVLASRGPGVRVNASGVPQSPPHWTPGRPGVRVIAKQFGVNPGTVQRISRPFEQDAVAL